MIDVKDFGVFSFDMTNTDYEVLLHDFASRMRGRVYNHHFELPPDYGIGQVQYFKLPNGLHAALFDFIWNRDWMFHRARNEDEFYTLRFEEVVVPGELEVTVDDQKIVENNTRRYMSYLSSSRTNWSYKGSAGAHLRGVSIIFSKKWLAGYLDINSTEDVLSAYLSMKAGNLGMEPLDAQYRQWMNAMWETEQNDPLRMTKIQNRVMLMIERFFAHLIEKMQNPALAVNLAPEDLKRVMHIESILTENIYQQPPPIQQLAKIASVSESKLKKDFKTMFKTPIYEYYQKARMQVAREKLLTGEFSVKEVAMELGYANLSNFTVAFKKEFGVLPSRLLKQEVKD
jgi:AraC-like DNA-binding protein